VINDTFETAITWERFEDFHDAIKAATENAMLETTGRKGEITCRFTHVYPDGPACYFTFHALGQPGKLGAQWRAIKSAALDAVIANGGTVPITMRSDAIIARGTTGSARRCSPRRCVPRRRRSTRRACSIPGFSSTHDVKPDSATVNNW
jgi:hypothetical protein